MDDTPVSIPAREVPDDIFISICAVLRAKMGNPIEPTDSDRLILRTLLNIQVVSKAGWRAATPIIWKNVILTSDKRYTSFFSPITRLLELSRERCFFRRSQILGMIKDDAACPAELDRFFTATRWISTIQIHSTPPESIRTELSLMSDLARKRLGTSFYLGEGIKLYFRGCLCSLLVHDEPTDGLAQLYSLVQGAWPAEITFWEPYYRSDCEMTWRNFEDIGRHCKDAVLVIPNLAPGQLENCSHPFTTVIVDPRNMPNPETFNNFDKDGSFFPEEIGSFLANCMSDHDPHCTETRLHVQLSLDFFREGWTKEIEDIDVVINRLAEGAIDEALRKLGEEGYLGCDEQDLTERIRNAFTSGRVTIRPLP